ncbi:MAG: helix-turn-helix transcriptional regulator [Amaricoccus sp.]
MNGDRRAGGGDPEQRPAGLPRRAGGRSGARPRARDTSRPIGPPAWPQRARDAGVRPQRAQRHLRARPRAGAAPAGAGCHDGAALGSGPGDAPALLRAPDADAGRGPLAVVARRAEVLVWVARGKSNGSIADILGISAHTVDAHLRRIYLKLGVADRLSAALRGLGFGIINLDA